MEHILSKLDSNSVTLSINDTENTTNESTGTTQSSSATKKSSQSKESEYGDYIDDEWVSMSKEKYAKDIRYCIMSSR